MLLRYQKFTADAFLRVNIMVGDDLGGESEREITVTDPALVAQAEALAAAIDAALPGVRATLKAERVALAQPMPEPVQAVGVVG